MSDRAHRDTLRETSRRVRKGATALMDAADRGRPDDTGVEVGDR